MVPEGWTTATFKDLLESGDIVSIQDGNHGDIHPKASDYVPSGVPFVMARDLRRGTIDFDNCSFISQRQADGLRIGHAYPGDVLISHKGTIGNVAVVPEDFEMVMLTPQVTLYRPSSDGGLDAGYLRSFLQSAWYQARFLALAFQSTRNYLGITQQKKFSISLPPLPEQRKIADILSTWDQAIEKTEVLLSNARTQKRALMQQLLTGKRRFPAYQGQPWKTGEFDDLFVVANDKKTQVNKRDYLPEGVTPVVDQGQNFIVGYTNHEQRYSDVPVIIFGDHTRALKWVDFEFCPGADGTQLLKAKPQLDQKLGYYMLQNLELPNLGYSRHMRELKQATFDYPPTVEEQSLLASVFIEADAEIALLEADLTKLRTEKKALMQQLLTGKRRVVV